MKHAAMILLLVLFGANPTDARYNDINYALGISGGSYVSVPNHSSLNNDLMLGQRFTIDAWIRPAAIGSDMAIVGNGVAYWFGLDANGKLKLRLNNLQIFTGNGTVGANVWTHAAVSVDLTTGSLRFYLNGALDRSISHTGSLSGSGGTFCIGADIGGAVAPVVVTPWSGALDEVRVWKSAIDFSTALGALVKTAHGMRWGLYGQHLVSAWRLNGGYLDNCGGNHGSMVGTGAFFTTPLPPFYERIGLAFQNQTATGGGGFSVATVAHSSTLNLTASYTVEFWMKPSTTSGHPSYQTLVCKGLGQSGTMAFWIGLNKSNGKIRFAPYGSFTITHESTVTVPNDQWTHVAVAFGPSLQGAYQSLIVINGNVAGVANLSQPTPGNTADLLIGAGATVAGANNVYGYGGVIDELRIWDHARSSVEIADNHRLELDGTQSGLAALYRFDGEIRDFSGNGNHSTDLVPTSTAYFVSTVDLPGPPSLTLLEPVAGVVWNVGESRTIRYQAVGLPWLRLELSRDGGATFPDTLAREANGAQGEFDWTVTGPVSTQCRIRAVTVSPTPGPIGDTSGVFTIDEQIPLLNVSPNPVQFLAQKDSALPPAVGLRIWNTGGGTLQWDITTSSPSWLSIAALSGSGNDQSIVLAVTTTALFAGEYTETLIVSSNASNGPIFVLVTYRVRTPGIWTLQGRTKYSDTLGFGDVPVHAEGPVSRTVWSQRGGGYEFTDLPGGNYIIAPRSRYLRFTPTHRLFMPLNNNERGVDFTGSTLDTTMMFHYSEGWNLVSLPLNIGHQEMSALLPDAVSPAFVFDIDSGYIRQTHIEHGYAYWIRFTRTDSIALTGYAFRYTGETASDKISGWRTIAMPSGDVMVDDIVESAPDILVRIYAYDPISGYIDPPDGRLRSGHAYFVKLHAPGHIVLKAMEEEEEPSSAPPMLLKEVQGFAPDKDDNRDDGLPPPPPRYGRYP